MKSCRRVVEALESAFCCHVCFHDYEGRIIPGAGNFPLFHRNPACERVRCGRQGFLLCCDMEARESRQALLTRRQSLFKRCHAGLFELAVPVYYRRNLTGAMFVGPFRAVELPSGAGTLLEQERSRVAADGGSLPALSRTEAENLIVFAELAALRLEMTFDAGPEITSDSPYEERIRYFFDREFRREVYLRDLAAFLGVGEIRVCQLLRQHFDATFSELLTQRRLEHARYLLKDSMIKIEAVAGACGFADPAYFYRVFRRGAGMTPGRYRRQFQTEKVSPSSLLA